MGMLPARALSAALAVATFALAMMSSGCGGAHSSPTPPLPSVAPTELRSPRDFANIPNAEDRSRALFLEASRVMLHPRCKNCHPDGNSPAQGDDGQLHDPPIARGPEDKGVPGLECTSCHQDENQAIARVPGAPKWHLAPLSMAWVNRTPQALCEQIKDTKRNGGKTLAQIVDHSAHDALVAWGWSPGHGRTPAPGSQQQFGELMEAWAKDGAACPRAEGKK
jgi:hypothetical protein